jgi:hypothetical protein
MTQNQHQQKNDSEGSTLNIGETVDALNELLKIVEDCPNCSQKFKAVLEDKMRKKFT